MLVRGDRIVEVGPASKVKAPAGALRVDGRGKYLMPGLAERHGHIPPPQAPKEFTEAVLFMDFANGVTTVRGMLGAPGQLELRERANRGELLSPTLYLAGPSFNGNSVSSPAQAAEMVRQQKREGWDLLKAATRNAGEYHEDKARFGTVAAGSRADLILVDGDPLKDLSNVARRAGVMARGRWLAEDEIQKRLASIAASGRPRPGAPPCPARV